MEKMHGEVGNKEEEEGGGEIYGGLEEEGEWKGWLGRR